MRGFTRLVVMLGMVGWISERTPGAGADPVTSAKDVKTSWTVDDVVLAETAGGFQISPDGEWTVWIKRAPDKEKGEMVSHLMLSRLTKAGQAITLTRGPHSCTSPRWSPDGQYLAFLSARPAPKSKIGRDGDEEEDKDESKTQVWLMHPFGGEPWPVTKAPRDVRDFGWAGTQTIVYAAQEKKGHYETSLKEKKDTSQVVEDEVNEPPVRLFTVTVDGKKVTRLTANTDRIQSVNVSPDGRYAVTIHERSLSYTFDHKIKPVVFLYDLKKGDGKQIFADRTFNVQNIHWQPDSNGFFAINAHTSHPRFLMAYILDLYHYDLGRGEAAKVDLAWDKGLADGSAGFSATAGGFVALLANGARHKPARFTRAGQVWQRQWLQGDHSANLFFFRLAGKSQTAIYQHSTLSTPPVWHVGKVDGDQLKPGFVLADLQKDLRDKPRAKGEIVRWKGANGAEVEGLLLYPHQFQEGKKYSLVVLIHGGPHGADFDQWEENWAYVSNLLCARGAFVLKPNYHGSSHYGLKFAEAIEGKYYLPVVDIEKGIDALVAKGLVDAGKLGLSGWSNGAILTMALITRRHYQAASAGAGGSEWVADWGTCEFGMSFSNYYLGKSPLEDPKVYFQNAPWYDFPKVRTPTLLFHGSDDRVVPTHHGWMQFRALQQLGKTDVRFLLFPGEKHSLKKLAHQKRKVTEELAWFDKYLFRSAQSENLAFKATSPLAQALTLHQSAKHGRLYGIQDKGILVPETVPYNNLHVGRFEVTRAQFALFDKTYRVEPSTENYPANGVTLEQSKAYCQWLSKATGQNYRLGRIGELEGLYDSGESTENTLDYWAGYSVNPEDRQRLQEKIRQLPGKAPLLKEVGGFKAVSETTSIFDLGGNVAEWVLDDKGQGRVLGGSADTAGDDRPRRPGPEYIGFRVVKEK